MFKITKMGGEMRLNVYIAVTAISFFGFSGVGFAGSSMHVDIAKKHCNEMVVAGESGLDHGGQGHGGVAVKHFKKMIHEAGECVGHGQGGIDASDASEATKMHGPEAMSLMKEAMSHAKTAVKHGELGHLDVLMGHGKDALALAREGLKHANEMN